MAGLRKPTGNIKLWVTWFYLHIRKVPVKADMQKDKRVRLGSRQGSQKGGC